MSQIQSIKSAARGFRIFRNYWIRILFFCGKLDLPPARHFAGRIQIFGGERVRPFDPSPADVSRLRWLSGRGCRPADPLGGMDGSRLTPATASGSLAKGGRWCSAATAVTTSATRCDRLYGLLKRKNKLPVGEVMLMEFVPFAVLTA